MVRSRRAPLPGLKRSYTQWRRRALRHIPTLDPQPLPLGTRLIAFAIWAISLLFVAGFGALITGQLHLALAAVPFVSVLPTATSL